MNKIQNVLNTLIKIAEENRDLRILGDRQYEYDIPDYIFSKLVSKNIEQKILDLMVESKTWERGIEGFFYK